MKRKLLVGILSGAAVGAAASYLWNSNNRETLASGIKNISGKAGDIVGGLLNRDTENEAASNDLTSSSSQTANRGSRSNTSRRG